MTWPSTYSRWPRSTATLLDDAGVTARKIADKLGSNRAVANPDSVRRRIREAEAALDDAEEVLSRAAPALLAAHRRPPPSPELYEVQALLPTGTLLVQYHVFDDELVTWALTSERALALRREAITPELAAVSARFHRACATSYSSEEERAALGGNLAAMLLAPLDADLAACERVVFIPHGTLALIPFHLLPHHARLLGDSHAVSYLPAASALTRREQRVVTRLHEGAVVVGDPDYAPDRGLPQLPGARTEAIAVARRLGVAPFVGGVAARDAVTAAIPAARVLHLATHGLVRDDAPASAELTLAGNDSLTIPDLLGLDTRLDLAVLSACHSGRGRPTTGGDVVGLTRAMLAAGVRDLVVSLWPVDDRRRDEAYAALCAEADTEPARGAGPSRDWPAAAVPPVEDPHHPYFWGPFIHVGI